MQQLPDFDSRDATSYLKWITCNSRRKVCVNYQTESDKLNILVYRYRNNIYRKDSETQLKMTEYRKLLCNRVNCLRHIDQFLCVALNWMKQLFIIETNIVKNGCSLSIDNFSVLLGSKFVISTQWCSQKPFHQCMPLLG